MFDNTAHLMLLDAELTRRNAPPTKNKKLVIALENKLDRLRRLSNVIQALENVSAQCADDAEFDELRMQTELKVDFFQRTLRQELHG